jgi:hypothetical protein
MWSGSSDGNVVADPMCLMRNRFDLDWLHSAQPTPSNDYGASDACKQRIMIVSIPWSYRSELEK